MTARLLLINGPPGIGKSTIAGRYVAEHPLALRLDVDELRRSLGGWEAHDHDAGLLARDLALAMARTHLAAGRDVVVPQYLARPAFADALGEVAAQSGAAFAEVALMDGRENALAGSRPAPATRRSRPTTPKPPLAPATPSRRCTTRWSRSSRPGRTSLSSLRATATSTAPTARCSPRSGGSPEARTPAR